jgi:DEAD/DEAH box helicase
VQKRAALVLEEGADCIIHCETGSGKTLAFLVPLLAKLEYPPTVHPEDLKARSSPLCLSISRHLHPPFVCLSLSLSIRPPVRQPACLTFHVLAGMPYVNHVSPRIGARVAAHGNPCALVRA